ncbi:MAG: hypothetical protein A3J28_17000 [Acidobacteria bacterium RIFCSPLOWO2_12_FULL_60_22]|nr:MAG: hypothetical protein A3J28_17000 [Acidobacteria bacterium RIFCSPLOWO2_12_FULL_60_22]
MKIVLSNRAIDALTNSPPSTQRAFEKQLRFLAHNLHHPSLRAKKYRETEELWQARVNRNWRFYFKIVGDAYIITDVIAHPK